MKYFNDNKTVFYSEEVSLENNWNPRPIGSFSMPFDGEVEISFRIGGNDKTVILDNISLHEEGCDNNVDQNSENSCQDNAETCCESDIVLDASNLVSKTYKASNSIKVLGNVLSAVDVIFDATTVILEPTFEVEPKAVITINLTGCQ